MHATCALEIATFNRFRLKKKKRLRKLWVKEVYIKLLKKFKI